MKVERECDEATRKKVKLKEQTTSRLKDKDDALIKECTRAANMATWLDHSEVQCQLATAKALAGEERAKAAKERSKVESNRARAAEDQVRAAEAWANAAES